MSNVNEKIEEFLAYVAEENNSYWERLFKVKDDPNKFHQEVISIIDEMRDDSDYDIYEFSEFARELAQIQYTEEELRVAQAELSEYVKQFKAILSKAEDHATKYGLSFSISPAYGMGGHFEYGWSPSSQSC